MIEPSGQSPIGQKVLYLVQAQVSGEAGSPNPPIDTIKIQGQTLTAVTNSDNSVWGQTLLVAPAGAYEDVTPDPPGNYNYNVTSTVPTLQIIDKVTSNVLSGKTTPVIVGQQMNLSCQLSVTNSGFNNSMLTNFQWTVPGYTISNYVVAPDTSTAYVETNFPTTNSSIAFYWADGATNLALATNTVVSCSAKIDGITISNQAVFEIVRPMAAVTDYTATVTLDYSNPFNVPWLHFGSFLDGQQPGIQFMTNFLILPTAYYNYGNFDYTVEWVQEVFPSLWQQEKNNGVWGEIQITNPVLDTVYPLPKPQDSPNSRNLTGFNAVSITESFRTWLMFKPAGGQWIPLRSCNWNWSGVGTNFGGTNWILASPPSWSTNPPDANATSFPTWSNNLTNFMFHTE